MIRRALLSDIPALTAIENRCFAADRIAPRSFRYLLTRANAAVVVEERRGSIRGYAAVLFYRTTPLARLYSIAVDPEWRGRAIGRALILQAEHIAASRKARRLRLEVRVDNRRARAMYRKRGYRQFAVACGYYEDRTDALRLEKTLRRHTRGPMMGLANRKPPHRAGWE
ncbi:MAG: N-acetyltransferase [Rhodospirillales bacterium]|nr:N-acetyltransferase [Rhodospirillales bacterium]